MKNATNPLEVVYALKGIEYPVTRKGLLECAQKNGAPLPIIQVIERLPNKHYHAPIEISTEISDVCYY
jgi:hypothetical protein